MWIANVALFLVTAPILGGLAVPNCSNDFPCVRFCCLNCTHDFDIRDLPGANKIKPEYRVMQGRPCHGGMFAADEEFTFLPSGEITIPDSKPLLTTDEYCFDWLEDYGEKWTLLLCFEDDETAQEMRFTLYPIRKDEQQIFPYNVMFLSLPFSIATFLVYACIKELRNLHGKCLMCYVACVIVLQFDLALIQLEVYEKGTPCTLAGFLLYFTAFASNFWLNVMSFDIWRTFKNFRITSDADSRFRIYCCYAFATPLLMTLILLIVDNIPSNAIESYRPNFGTLYCAIQTDHMDLYYYMIPLSILNVFSALFMILAGYHYLKRSTIENATGYTRFGTEKDRFFMYSCIFWFMAVIWSCEMISNFVHFKEFIINDILHCLQGMVIFAIFVLHKSTRQLVVKEFYTFRGNPIEQPKEETGDSESNGGNFQKL